MRSFCALSTILLLAAACGGSSSKEEERRSVVVAETAMVRESMISSDTVAQLPKGTEVYALRDSLSLNGTNYVKVIFGTDQEGYMHVEDLVLKTAMQLPTDTPATPPGSGEAKKYFSETIQLDTAGSIAPILVYVPTYSGTIPGVGKARVKLELDPDFVRGILVTEKGDTSNLSFAWETPGQTLVSNIDGTKWGVTDGGITLVYKPGQAPVSFAKDPWTIPALDFKLYYKYNGSEVSTDIIEISDRDGLQETCLFESNKPSSYERETLKIFFEDMDGDGDADVRYFENAGDEGTYYDQWLYDSDNNMIDYKDEWGDGALYNFFLPKKK